MSLRIGIDVGGTNTDAVLLDGTTVRSSAKHTTSADVTSGIVEAIEELIGRQPDASDQVRTVMIGTTHFTNAVVSGVGLTPTGIIRLGAPAGAGIPPLSDWPAHLAGAVDSSHTHLVPGGVEFDGRPITELDEDQIDQIARGLAADGVQAVAVTSIFAPVSEQDERRTAELLRRHLPAAGISLSHQVGSVGLLERENSTILNAALLLQARRVTEAFTAALDRVGIHAPVYLSQNDGTLMDLDLATQYPVATFASGPTNSMRGAALLSGLSDCLVVDIGGTTSDIGALVAGFPRPAGAAVHIGGVRTNFRMPDVLSLGIGGGSIVRTDPVRIGPDSVGHDLTTKARVFGGDTLTATDLAVAGGLVQIGDPQLVADLPKELVDQGLTQIADRIGQTADAMRTSAEPVPLVLVGGGSVLVTDEIPGFETVLRPDHAAVANAIGAAVAQVGGEVDRMYSFEGQDRSAILAQARQEAIDAAVDAGAIADTVNVVSIEEVPIAYLPGGAARVQIKAVGDLIATGSGRMTS